MATKCKRTTNSLSFSYSCTRISDGNGLVILTEPFNMQINPCLKMSYEVWMCVCVCMMSYAQNEMENRLTTTITANNKNENSSSKCHFRFETYKLIRARYKRNTLSIFLLLLFTNLRHSTRVNISHSRSRFLVLPLQIHTRPVFS